MNREELIKKAEKELEYFNTFYCAPLNNHVAKASDIMEGWDDKNVEFDKKKAQDKYRILWQRSNDFNRLFQAVNELIKFKEPKTEEVIINEK